jgi:cysteinyl-tRNA synthetase
MSLKLYNTLTRKKEIFKPLKQVVGFYSCGPTGYWYPHIGNMKAYVHWDIVERTLKFIGYKIKIYECY